MAEYITWFDASNLASINASVQIGDKSYYSPISTSGKFSVANKSDIVDVGEITDIRLIDTTALDTTSNNGLVNANEAYIDFIGDQAECGWDGANCASTGIIRINKSYKEAGIIPGMSIDLGVAPLLTSTGTLTSFSSSIFSKQAISSNGYLYVKSVNPNGDDPNEIEIAQYLTYEGHPSFQYSNSESADITPDDNSEVATKGLSKLKSLQYSSGVPQYKLDQQFQNRPTRVKFSFDNKTATMFTGQGVYPSTGVSYPSGTSTGILSPWYGKTKFWMITSSTPTNSALNANIGDLQMFSKNNTVNMTSPKGYFAKAKIVNNSKIKSEMFAISVDTYMSSK